MTDVVKKSTHPNLPLPIAREASNAEERRKIQELTTALAARDSFLALVGHELRNALAPMLLLVEQLDALTKDPQAPAGVSSRAAMLTRNVNSLVSTIERVADVTDLRRGKLHLDCATANLADVVEDVCRETRRLATASGALIVLTAERPVVGQWDRSRVKQLVSNLLHNAIHRGGGTIEVSVSDTGEGGELVIRDHGPAYEVEALPSAFEFPEHGGAKGSGRFGMGLWVVKALCSAMRGTVTVENASGGGARFCVVLPRG